MIIFIVAVDDILGRTFTSSENEKKMKQLIVNNIPVRCRYAIILLQVISDEHVNSGANKLKKRIDPSNVYTHARTRYGNEGINLFCSSKNFVKFIITESYTYVYIYIQQIRYTCTYIYIYAYLHTCPLKHCMHKRT